MICPICRKEIPSDSVFCCYCGGSITLSKGNIGSETPLNDKESSLINQEVVPTWGYFINEDGYGYGRSKTCPGWVKKIQQDKWEERGLIIWDKNESQVTKMWAGQALKLFHEMRNSDGWKEVGLTVGEPAIQISLEETRKSKRKGKRDQKIQEEQSPKPPDEKRVLTNPIILTGVQALELFAFLQQNEQLLQDIAKKEEKEKSERLSAVYQLILGDKLWNALGELYRVNPDEAVKLGMDAVRTALGEGENQDQNNK